MFGKVLVADAPVIVRGPEHLLILCLDTGEDLVPPGWKAVEETQLSFFGVQTQSHHQCVRLWQKGEATNCGMARCGDNSKCHVLSAIKNGHAFPGQCHILPLLSMYLSASFLFPNPAVINRNGSQLNWENSTQMKCLRKVERAEGSWQQAKFSSWPS